jgi:4-methyl-5(b-hydroxyethyl)-thiazole monophosphate biosynthesis
MTRVLIPLADGVEEMEAVIIADVLRRAGWQVVLAGIAGPDPVVGSRGVRLIPDAAFGDENLATFDMLVLPGGGPGTQTLCRTEEVLDAVRDFTAAGKTVGAICAAPLVLHAAGVIAGRTVTCFPGVGPQLKGARVLADRVVIDGQLVTSQGPGTAMAFALALIRQRDGEAAARKVSEGLIA